MNAETFCEHFATFADAPNGIAKLRELILHLAVHGKLVPQDPNEGDARTVINVALETRQQTIVSKSLRRKELDESFDLVEYEGFPLSWCIERLANLVDPENTISYGVLVPGNDVPDGVPFVRAQDLYLANHPARPNKTIAPEIERPYARTRLTGGEILLCVVGSIGKLGTVPDSWAGANIARAVARIKPIHAVNRDYLLIVLQEKAVQTYFTSTTRTLAQPTLNVGMIEQTPIPVPPLAEQRRIVEKVDQLLGLCDELVARQAAQREKRQRLVGATLDRLVSGRNPAEFPTHAHRLRNHFDQLFDTPTTIPQLRRTILQLAIQGQLVQQDPKDEPAIETVRRVEHERQAMIADGKLREEKLLLPTVDASTSPMPRGWADVRLGYVINCLDHIRRPVSKEERETKRGKYPYYGANGQVGWIDDFLFDEDLVLVVEDESFIGRVKPFSYKITGKTWVNNHAHVLQPTFAVDVDFLNYALSFYPFTPLTSGTTNRKKLTKVGLMNAPFQLPPVAEQKRIACKVTELLSLCDALEAKLTQAESASTQLLSAAVHQLLNGAVANV